MPSMLISRQLPEERPRRDHVRDRPRDLREQPLHGLGAEPLPRLGDPARVGARSQDSSQPSQSANVPASLAATSS